MVVNVIASVITPVTIDVTCTAAVRAEKIAYSADYYAGGKSSSIELVDVDGSNEELIQAGSAPSWSPARDRLVFSTTRCGSDFYYDNICTGGLVLLDPETGNFTSPLGGRMGHAPSWSPTRAAIAFARENEGTNERQMAILDLPSGTAEPLVMRGLVSGDEPSWSPDGRRIAFVCWVDSHYDLCIVNADGSGLERVTDDAAVERHPAWSPDGRTIAFHRYPVGTAAVPPGEIDLIDLATRRITTLTSGTDPAWSPDGSRLVFAGLDGLFVMRSDGTNRTRLTAGDHHAPAWRP